MKPRNAFEHSHNWPVCYRTQKDAELPQGRFREEVSNEHWFWFAALFTLIVVAPALVEWIV